jgi:hypothetical protein
MTKYGLDLTVNYPDREIDEHDSKDRSGKELLEAISFAIHKHEGATSFVFTVVVDPE